MAFRDYELRVKLNGNIPARGVGGALRIDDAEGVAEIDFETLTLAQLFENARALATSPAVAAVAATGELTISVQPTAADTITIGDETYTFRATADYDAAHEIELILDGEMEADLPGTLASIVDAINGDDAENAPNAFATAALVDGVIVLTAILAGPVGLGVATTSSLTEVGDGFGATTLEGGTAAVLESFAVAESRSTRVRLGSDTYLLTGDGVPADYAGDGVDVGTGEGFAGTGSFYVDVTNAIVYVNTGTADEPEWTALSAAGHTHE